MEATGLSAQRQEQYKEQLPTVADATIIVGGIPLQALVACGSRVDSLDRTVAERCVRSFSSVRGRLLVKLASEHTDSNISIASPVELRMRSAHTTLSGRRPLYIVGICYDAVLELPCVRHWSASLCCSGPGVVLQTDAGVVYLPRTSARSRSKGPVKVHQTAVERTGKEEAGEQQVHQECKPVQYRARRSTSVR